MGENRLGTKEKAAGEGGENALENEDQGRTLRSQVHHQVRERLSSNGKGVRAKSFPPVNIKERRDRVCGGGSVWAHGGGDVPWQ